MRRCLPIFVLAFALALPGCTKYSDDDPLLHKDPKSLTPAEMSRMVAVMVTDYGRVVIELHPEWAPKATENFISLIRSGYYDGLTICEILPGVWLRGGAPQTTECKGTPGYDVPIESPSAPVIRGAVGLYHYDMQPDTGTSQFFIMLNDSTRMNDGYTIFGRVIEGMPAVDRIGQIKTTGYDGKPRQYMPLTHIVINDLHLEVKK